MFCSHESLSFCVVTCNKNVGFKTNTGQHSQFYRSHFGDNTQQAGYRSFPLVNNFNTVLPAEKDSNNDHHYHHICNYILMQEQRCCHYVSGQKVISSTSINKKNLKKMRKRKQRYRFKIYVWFTELDLYIHTQTVTHQQENKTTNKKERVGGGEDRKRWFVWFQLSQLV